MGSRLHVLRSRFVCGMCIPKSLPMLNLPKWEYKEEKQDLVRERERPKWLPKWFLPVLMILCS